MESRPLLKDKPLLIEQARAVDSVEFSTKVVKRHPEFSVVAEAVIEFLHPVWSPLLRAVTPRTAPLTHTVPGAPAPRVTGEMVSDLPDTLFGSGGPYCHTPSRSLTESEPTEPSYHPRPRPLPPLKQSRRDSAQGLVSTRNLFPMMVTTPQRETPC